MTCAIPVNPDRNPCRAVARGFEECGLTGLKSARSQESSMDAHHFIIEVVCTEKARNPGPYGRGDLCSPVELESALFAPQASRQHVTQVPQLRRFAQDTLQVRGNVPVCNESLSPPGQQQDARVRSRCLHSAAY